MENITVNLPEKEILNLMATFRVLPFFMFKKYLYKRRFIYTDDMLWQLIKRYGFYVQHHRISSKPNLIDTKKKTHLKINVLETILDLSASENLPQTKISYRAYRMKKGAIFYEGIITNPQKMNRVYAFLEEDLKKDQTVLSYIHRIENKRLLILTKEIQDITPIVLPNSKTIYFDHEGRRRIFKA